MKENKNFTGYSISTKLYDWLLKNISKNQTILEIGSGTGTIELANNFNVISIDHNPEWINLTDKCNYILAKLKNNWYDITILKNELPKYNYNVIIVDAPNGSKPRYGFIDNLHLFDLSNVNYIIVDDTNRETEKKIVRYLNNNTEFKTLMTQKTNKEFTILKKQ